MFVTVVTPTGKVLPLSVALTVKVTLLRLHRPVSAVKTRLPGQAVKTGFSKSFTVTVKVQTLVLPLASVTVLVTVVTPTGKVLPLGGVLTTVTTPQLSVALTLNVTLLRLQ